MASGLPSALSALDGLEGPPSYLTPEATRPLASSAYHGRLVQAAGINAQTACQQKKKRKHQAVQRRFDDIGKMRVIGLPLNPSTCVLCCTCSQQAILPSVDSIHSTVADVTVLLMLKALLVVQQRHAVRMLLASATGTQAMRLESGTSPRWLLSSRARRKRATLFMMSAIVCLQPTAFMTDNTCSCLSYRGHTAFLDHTRSTQDVLF